MQENYMFDFIYNTRNDVFEFWCNKKLMVSATADYMKDFRNVGESSLSAFKRYCGKVFWDTMTSEPLFSDRCLIEHVFKNKYERHLDKDEYL